VKHAIAALCLLTAAGALGAGSAGAEETGAPFPFTDVANGHFARDAIRIVSVDNDWLPAGATRFWPASALKRRHLASALVAAFAPEEVVDPELLFSDLDPAEPPFAVANVAVKLGWMKSKGDAFDPMGPVSKRVFDRAVIRALGLQETARALDGVSAEDGYRFKTPHMFGDMVLADQLRLHYNYPVGAERFERRPADPMRRQDAAYGLARAVQASSGWEVASLDRYASMVLPPMSAKRARAVEWAFRHVGWPYVYAGEWSKPTPGGYCCGSQAQGGFDCSGFAWWVLNQPTGSWDPTRLRPYEGWSLPQRSSYEMARVTSKRRGLAHMRPLDVALFHTSGPDRTWSDMDHAGVYLGNGWMIHSSGSRGGVTIDKIDEGWWKDAFGWGRRVVPWRV